MEIRELVGYGLATKFYGDNYCKNKHVLPTTKDVWDSVRETYLDLEKSSQIFEVKSKTLQSKQEDHEATIYYNVMVALWQELNQCHDDV